jgi:2-phosphoglycolate phosphatase
MGCESHTWLRAVLFDLDGTLVDSHRDIARAVNDVLAALGLEPHPEATIRGMIGEGATVLLVRALGPDAEALLRPAKERFAPAYLARLTESTTLYPGIATMLEALRGAGIPWGIATNKPAAFTGPLVEALALPRLGLGAWASADEVDARKPDPAVLRLALERLGVRADPARVAYVGDMALDVLTARRLGARALGVAWGYDPGGLAELEAPVASDPARLLELLLGPGRA